MGNMGTDTSKHISWRKGLFALSPLLLLFLLCLLWGFCSGNHDIPLTSLLVITIVYALAITKRPPSFQERINVLSNGLLDIDVITMVWIFMLVSIFSATSKSIGAVENLSELMAWLFPGKFFLCGIFLAACLMSFITGTSMGTVLIMTPMISQFSHPEINLAVVAAAVCSGSFFGDNLSMISDTTVAAVQTLECNPQKKFFYNLRIAAPAVIVTLVMYYFICPESIQIHSATPDINVFLLAPFLIVLVLAIFGINVIPALFIGICFNLVIGWLTSKEGLGIFFGGFLLTTASGIEEMGELIGLTFLCCGLLALIRHNGGLGFIVKRMSRFKNKKWSEFSAALLVSFVNICTINNTVAILTTGPVVKDLTEHSDIKDYRMASIIDVFACVTQGLLPFSAQVLVAAKEANVSVFSVIFHSYFLFALVVSAASAIFIKKIHLKNI